LLLLERMPTTRAWVLLLLGGALMGCGRRELAPDAGAAGSGQAGSTPDGGPGGSSGGGGSSGAGSGGAAGTGAAGTGTGGSGSAACSRETPDGVLAPSTTCHVAPVPAAPCASAAACPVGAMFSLTCAGDGYGPWLVPSGPGATVMFVTNTNGFHTRLFTLGVDGPARVDDVLSLTSASNALAVDADGNPIIYAGEMPGVWRVRKTALGWQREEALGVSNNALALVTGGVSRGAKDFVAYYGLDDYAPRLLTHDGDCWHSTLLPGTRLTDMAVDVDAQDRPWVAWYGGENGNIPFVELWGPDGGHRIWNGASPQVPNVHDRPVVLAGGLSGTAAYPAVAMQQDDGIHVFVPDEAMPQWTDHPQPNTALTQRTGGCPAQTFSGCEPVVGSAGNATASCVEMTKGTLAGVGLARTASGRTYVAWLEADGQTTYSVSGLEPAPSACPVGVDGPPGAGVAPPACPCITLAPVSSSGTVSVVIARVDVASPPLRVQLDAGGEARYGDIEMAARGNTLLVVAAPRAGTDTAMRYLEVDTTKLP
jgi:hypothetical protein